MIGTGGIIDVVDGVNWEVEWRVEQQHRKRRSTYFQGTSRGDWYFIHVITTIYHVLIYLRGGSSCFVFDNNHCVTVVINDSSDLYLIRWWWIHIQGEALDSQMRYNAVGREHSQRNGRMMWASRSSYLILRPTGADREGIWWCTFSTTNTKQDKRRYESHMIHTDTEVRAMIRLWHEEAYGRWCE